MWEFNLSLHTDNGSGPTFDLSIEVLGENNKPVLETTLNHSSDQDQPFSLVFDFTDLDELTNYTSEILSMPDWLNYDQETLTLFGTPETTMLVTTISD